MLPTLKLIKYWSVYINGILLNHPIYNNDICFLLVIIYAGQQKRIDLLLINADHHYFGIKFF